MLLLAFDPGQIQNGRNENVAGDIRTNALPTLRGIRGESALVTSLLAVSTGTHFYTCRCVPICEGKRMGSVSIKLLAP
jgi:hypothetical protein